MSTYMNNLKKHNEIVSEINNISIKTNIITKMEEELTKFNEIKTKELIDPESEKNLTHSLNGQMYDMYNKWTMQNYQSTVDEIFTKIKFKLKDEEKCFQGGKGHHIYSNPNIFPCHWCVRPEFYEEVKLKPYEMIVLKIVNHDIIINEKEEHERWGN